MSYKEDLENIVTFSYDDENNRPIQALYNQPYCSYCYERHTNEVGVVSLKHKQWFCSENCKCTYFYENGLVQYTPEVIQVIRDTRQKCYSQEKIASRKKDIHQKY